MKLKSLVAITLSTSLRPLYTSHFLIPPLLTIPSIFQNSPISHYSPFTTTMAAACVFSAPPKPNPKNIDNYRYIPNFPDLHSRTLHTQSQPIQHFSPEEDIVYQNEQEPEDVWEQMKQEANYDIIKEPILKPYYTTTILSHNSLQTSLSNILSIKLTNPTLPSQTLNTLFLSILTSNPNILNSVVHDLRAVKQRDPACMNYVHCFLNFKGFLAIQAHRIAHHLWNYNRRTLALLIQNRVSEVFAVDIHPGARIGNGVMLDHATGVVIGETAVVGDDVSILHNVTLGGTGKVGGDRHPKIGDGVLIGSGSCVLGNVVIEDGAKIGAGSVVLKRVPARTTAVGNPARLLGGKENPVRMDKVPSFTMDQTSHGSDWSDYVI